MDFIFSVAFPFKSVNIQYKVQIAASETSQHQKSKQTQQRDSKIIRCGQINCLVHYTGFYTHDVNKKTKKTTLHQKKSLYCSQLHLWTDETNINFCQIKKNMEGGKELLRI